MRLRHKLCEIVEPAPCGLNVAIPKMKTIQRTLLYSIIPLVAPLTVTAQTQVNTSTDQAVANVNKVTSSSWRASQVIGTNLKNAANETIGEVEDLVLDMKKGEILAVVISSGGFLGIADHLSSIPVTALRYDTNEKAFKTDLTKEELGKAPHFNKSNWPNYDDPTTAGKLRAYRDAIGGDVSAPDNTAQNEEELKREAIDPTNQGNSDQDLETTRKIRSEIVDQDLSFSTKNIKIITKDGNVTLKGVVKNHAEHEVVLKIAGKHADKSKITDELKMDEK